MLQGQPINFALPVAEATYLFCHMPQREGEELFEFLRAESSAFPPCSYIRGKHEQNTDILAGYFII